MSSKKITLIIGAGASKDINPTIYTGEELTKGIADRVTDRNSPGKEYLSEKLKIKLGINTEIRERFLIHLENYRTNPLILNPSIDEFLNEVNNFKEFETDRNVFLQIGYVMILAHIFGFEGREDDATQKALFKENTWLTILSDEIEKNKILEAPLDNRLRIITFNYDRIIELYLLRKYNKSKEIIEFINNNILHVYGRAGALDGLQLRELEGGLKEKVIPFGFANDQLDKIDGIKTHIKVIYEKRNDASFLKELKEIITTSTDIFAFGYGFDTVNNSRLGFQNINTIEQRFVANVFSNRSLSFDFNERRKMTEKIRRIVPDADIHYGTCSEFLEYCFRN